jgi:hypothetical protein
MAVLTRRSGTPESFIYATSEACAHAPELIAIGDIAEASCSENDVRLTETWVYVVNGRTKTSQKCSK